MSKLRNDRWLSFLLCKSYEENALKHPQTLQRILNKGCSYCFVCENDSYSKENTHFFSDKLDISVQLGRNELQVFISQLLSLRIYSRKPILPEEKSVKGVLLTLL